MHAIYLAGPEVFLPDAVAIGRRKVAICGRHGLKGMFPLDLDGGAEGDSAAAIYRGCLAAMRSADAIVANLTPFRGIGADAGTAFELGFMVASGRPVFGYTNDPAPLTERVAAAFGPLSDASGRLVAADGMSVEDFGRFDNLMLAEALLMGGPGIFAPSAPVADPARDLVTFERCVAHVASALEVGPNT